MDKSLLKARVSAILRERDIRSNGIVIQNDIFGIGGSRIPVENLERFMFSVLDEAWRESGKSKGGVRTKSTSVPVKAVMVDDDRCEISRGGIALLAEALGVNKKSVGNHLKDGLPLVDHNGDRWLIKRMTDSEVRELGRVY